MSATDESAAATAVAGPPAHRDRNVLRWLVAYTASVVGDSGFFLALGWAANQHGGPARVGLIMAIAAIPRAVLMLGGGVVADLFGPRRVVIGSDTVRCLVVLGAAAALALSSPGLWLLIAVALVFSVVDALFMPAVGALPPLLAAPGELVRVQGMRALCIRLGQTAGPPLAGVALALGGPAAAFTVAGGLFALSLVLLLAVRIPGAGSTAAAATPAGRPSRAAAWRELVDGLRYIRRRPLIRRLVLASALIELGAGGPLNVGMVVLADARGWGASGAGWLAGAFGVGAGASALLLTVTGRLPRAGAVLIAALAAGSAGLAGLGSTTVLPIAVAVAACAGLLFGLNGGLAYALVQTATEPAYQGRVASVLGLTAFGLGPIAFPLFGTTVAATGPGPAYAIFAGISALGAAVGLTSPSIRRAELPR
ncbi:MFS transporter [Embleya hyalina]|uniref:MFS transporter n=1 Tax=Embleya hyalina TaxID=516124 RepID=A0A401Z0H0_9ACTN|nr:MFS transporter [Embleya hyalina]GCE00301.1 MFS transporter [Embleya hyalina]